MRLPGSTCRRFERGRWRCPIRNVWWALSWRDCGWNPAPRCARKAEIRWNPREQVRWIRRRLVSRSSSARFWLRFPWPRNRRCPATTVSDRSSSPSRERERICQPPLRGRTAKKQGIYLGQIYLQINSYFDKSARPFGKLNVESRTRNKFYVCRNRCGKEIRASHIWKASNYKAWRNERIANTFRHAIDVHVCVCPR